MKKLNLLKLTLIPSLSLVAFSSIAITSTSCGIRKVDPRMLSIYAVGGTIVKLISNEGNNPDLSYSTNRKEWTKYTDPITLSAGSNLYLKGSNPNGFSKSTTVYSYFSFTGKISIGGSIMGLLDDGSASMSEIPNGYCFYDLFRDCSTIISVDKDFLKSAKSLANYCYGCMFQDCTSLKNAPNLPATTLAEMCYHNMFTGCTSLTQAPTKLPAKTLAYGCYHNMFQDCTSLKNAPNLPATTLAEMCYYGMFNDCTSLKNAPDLPAETLAKSCYNYMFANSTLLTNAPDLPALTLAENCYAGMFYNCTALENAPELPATRLAKNCYWSMFENCTSLTQAPKLLVTTLTYGCYMNMFQNCTKLTNAPDLPAETLVINCYEHMFYGCSSLSFVKIGYTGDFDQQYFQQWVEGVADSGIFDYKGTSGQIPQDFGFPTGWKLAE